MTITLEGVTDAYLQAAEHEDSARWTQADIVVMATEAFGVNVLRDFAAIVNAAYNTVKDRHSMGRFWTPEYRAQALAMEMNWSMCRTAKALGTPDAALAFLKECNDNNWRVERARIEVKKRKGETVPSTVIVGEFDAEVSYSADGRLMWLALPGDVPARNSGLTPGLYHVQFRVTAA